MNGSVNTDDRGALENADLNDEVYGKAFDKAAEAMDEEKPPKPADGEIEVPAEDPAPIVAPPIVAQPGDDDKAEQRYKTLQGMFNKEKETWESERANLLAQVEAVKKVPAPAPAPREARDDPDDLSPEDKEALAEYDQEFDLVSKMEGKKRDLALKALEKKFQNFLDEKIAEINSKIAPAQSFIQETVAERVRHNEEVHFSSLKEVHPDFETYRDDGTIIKWIESKPQYLQKSMLETYDQGSINDVVALLNDFKQENNITSSPDNTPKSTRKAEKKLAMTAVTTRRGAVNPAHVIANDFEGAWDEALNRQGG
jgi:hypothetical protein